MSDQTVQFCDKSRLKIQSVTLIIDVDRINEKYRSIKLFSESVKLPAKTNGKVFIISSSHQDVYKLQNFCTEVLIPNGFESLRDFIIVKEKYTCVPSTPGYFQDPYLWREFSDCRHIRSIRTLVTPDGNFIWHRDEKEDLFYSKERMQYLLIQYMAKNNPEKLRFRPSIAEVDKLRVRFGMSKHYGVLSLSTQYLLDVGSEFRIQ